MQIIKKLGIVLLLLAVFITPKPAAAYDGDEPEAVEHLREKVIEFVKTPNLAEFGIDKEKVRLKFLVNSNREIVVVSTGTENNYLDSFLKSRLNYKKIKDSQVEQGVYNMSITFKAS